jgi:sensor domain CHASE-containing protein
MLDAAQSNPAGIPQELIDKKKDEIKTRRVNTIRTDRIGGSMLHMITNFGGFRLFSTKVPIGVFLKTNVTINFLLKFALFSIFKKPSFGKNIKNECNFTN